MSKSPYRYVRWLSPVFRSARRFVFQYLYAGNGAACPTCERSFRTWRKDPLIGACPYCGSDPRHRFLWLYLSQQWKAGSKSVDLLHFAPEWCLRSRFQRDPRVARYVTADQGAPGVDFHVDITATTFEDGCFGAIVCSHVLEHVPDDRKAMRELLRVLRPGGVAYIQVPLSGEMAHTDEDPAVTDPKERERRFGQFDHLRVYGRDVTDRLREAGFEVTEVRPRDLMDVGQMASQGLWDDVIFRCERPLPTGARLDFHDPKTR
ncbi:MAG TPA: methyltransferase domain-containing protein [Polyangia bacterium]|nr:methyltransferase domain-containing protein [Polyangia bacterium]